jgi:phage baseplate assembly protein W
MSTWTYTVTDGTASGQASRGPTSTLFAWSVPASDARKGAPLTEDAKYYGRDVLFDPIEKDFPLGADGDYLTVEGEENLWFSLLRRIFTRPGEYRAHPDYGVGAREFRDAKLTKAKRDELAQRIVDNFSADPRVDEVLDVTVTEETIRGEIVTRAFIKILAGGRLLSRSLNITEAVR